MSTAAPRRSTRVSVRLRTASAEQDAAAAAQQAAQQEVEHPSPAQPRKRHRRAPAQSEEGADQGSPAARHGGGRKAKAPAAGPTREFERELWQQGYQRVAGVDEAGRGPLAGGMEQEALLRACANLASL
jgi:ribonuclease HII